MRCRWRRPSRGDQGGHSRTFPPRAHPLSPRRISSSTVRHHPSGVNPLRPGREPGGRKNPWPGGGRQWWPRPAGSGPGEQPGGVRRFLPDGHYLPADSGGPGGHAGRCRVLMSRGSKGMTTYLHSRRGIESRTGPGWNRARRRGRLMGPMARYQETLRRLAMIDEGFVEDEAGLGPCPRPGHRP